MALVSHSLSLFRAPLAFLFLQENSNLRILAVILAMITDSIDGYLARRNKTTSQFGAILDPAMDKFFVYFAMSILFFEGKLNLLEMAAMLSRDFFLCLYGLILLMMGKWKTLVFRGIRWGKATTALQFIILIGLVLGTVFPWYIFAAFLVMGGLGFIELFKPFDRAKSV
jgi:phosphatidylglycerophosphate synthase